MASIHIMKWQVFFILYMSCACAHSSPFLNRCVDTPSGRICGTTSYYQQRPVQTFLGIPFAQPPVGDLRFQKSLPMEPWSGAFMADKWPAACLQYSEYPSPSYDFEPGKSEDCLYLNIWAPECTKEGDKKAVLFWIYGGGLNGGSNRMDIYDARALAAEGDLIVVTINYRLGIFGFLTSNTEEAPPNLGLYDMLLALKWVNTSIESFGGDRDRITIDGESAGSWSVSFLCLSPLTAGLFSRAIMESGSGLILKSFPTDHNLKLGQKLAEGVGCASENTTLQNDPRKVIGCLRGKDAQLLIHVLYNFDPTSFLSFLPQYDDEIVPSNPTLQLKAGNFNKVPLLIGNNADEGSSTLTTSNMELFGFFGEKNPTINKSLGSTFIKNTLKSFPDPDSIVKQYFRDVKDDSYNAIRRQVYTAMGDFELLCPTLYFAESYADAGYSDVYYYFFVHHPSTSPWAPWMGVAHYVEVQFVFGLPLRYPSRYTQEEIQLSARMIRIWSQFAKLGYLTADLKWPKYSKQDHKYYILSTDNDGNLVGRGPHLENCNFFRGFFGF